MRQIFSVILIVFLLLLCAVAYCQQTAVIDSTYITNVNGVFYESHLIEYEDGSQTCDRARLGDTLQVFSTKMDNLRSTSASMASDIRVTSAYTSRVTEMVRHANAIKTQFKRSPLDSIWKPVRGLMIDSVWNIKEGGVARKIVFSQTAAGVTRYKIDTFTIRQCKYLGDVMRLENYLNSGKNVDLYRFPNGRWYNATKTIQMYLKSAGAARGTARALEPYTDPLNRQFMIPSPDVPGTYIWDGQKLTLAPPSPPAKKKKK